MHWRILPLAFCGALAFAQSSTAHDRMLKESRTCLHKRRLFW